MFMVLICAIVVTALVAWLCYKSMKPVSNASSADNYVEKDIILSINTENFLRKEKKRKKDND